MCKTLSIILFFSQKGNDNLANNSEYLMENSKVIYIPQKAYKIHFKTNQQLSTSNEQLNHIFMFITFIKCR